MTRAIVSRCTVFEFKRLQETDIKKLLQRALTAPQGLKDYRMRLDDEALNYFATACGGDVRSALNGLELCAITSEPNQNGEIIVDKNVAAECLQQKALNLDETLYYHILSAFCKSLRGSDTTAALYYANRLIAAGMQPQIIARRLIAHASEDVGLADSQAMIQACAALYALDNLGMPEGNLALTQAIVYVCQAPKDNRVVVLGSVNSEKGTATFVCACSKKAIEKGVLAGNVVREVAKIAGGNGGGKPDFAMAGGKDVTKVDDAIMKADEIVKSFIK